MVIGDGTQISKTGNFSDINWKINPKFLKVEMDPAGGSSFVAMGTTRLQAVPFAYYANGVNADRIRSGLLNDGMIKSRAKAREVSTDEYMRGNLLLNEVKAEDVAKAFFHLAVSKKTTGAVLTVDGGNIAASLR